MTEIARKQGPSRKAWTEDQSRLVFGVIRMLFGLILRFWVRRYRFVGVDKVPASSGVFVIANHTTALDPLLVGYPITTRMARGPGKIELFGNPIAAYVMRKLGIFPLRQDTADVAAARTMITLYRRGQLVIVYPEGGRSRSGELREFNPDFARLMIRLKADLLPAGIAGGNEVLPMGSLIPRRNTAVVVAFGEQFDLSAFYNRELTPETVQEASFELEHRVREMVELAHAERVKLTEWHS